MRLAAKPHFLSTGFATAAQSTQRELHFRIGILLAAENTASLGVANLNGIRKGDVATALTAGLTLGSSLGPDLAYRGGAMYPEDGTEVRRCNTD